MKYILILIIAGINILNVTCQTNYPKYEFRGVWVATVKNIDWPSKAGLSTEQQQIEIRDILDMHSKLGMNAVIMQVRPSADAFYPSELEPWSAYLTGTPGQAPNPYYDPLEYWIQESHKRGIEFHAWLNPFRVAVNSMEPLAGSHIAFKHPEWILKYGNSLYFDPGLPEVRSFVGRVVKDIVNRYDIDAVHFDDYFYPYPISGEEFPDTASFAFYNRSFRASDKADWRRENVDITIRMLNDSIKMTKWWVKFGISPFGVWRNKADDPEGSDTKGGTSNYDNLYANIIKWQRNGWIDYTMPQLYWQIGHSTVDFKTLATWWKNHSYDRAIYIGHAVYKSDNNSNVKEWTSPGELPKQIRMIRKIEGIDGSAFFSQKHFNRNLMGFQDSLIKRLYKTPAIVPPMKWIDNKPPKPVTKIRKSGRSVKWETEKPDDIMEKPDAFIVYLNKSGVIFNPNDPKFILSVQKESECVFKGSNRKKSTYEIRVSVLDRLKNESEISEPVMIKM